MEQKETWGTLPGSSGIMRLFGILLTIALVAAPALDSFAQPGRGGGRPGGSGGASDADRQKMREAMMQRMREGGGPPSMRGSEGGRPGEGGRPSYGGKPGEGGRPAYGGRSGEGQSSSRGGPSSSGKSSGGDSSQLTNFLRSIDTNRDGVLTMKEVPESRRQAVAGMMQKMGLDPSRPVSLKDLQARISSGSRGKPSSQDDPLVPGFGTDLELAEVPSFGVRIEEESTSSGGRSQQSGRSRGSSRGGEEEDRGAMIAKMILSRSDKNGDGVLTKDEWGSMRGDPKDYDRDKNGKITMDELVNRMSNRMNGVEDEGFETYRLSTATELLPDGLPDWFEEKDVDTDGQVSMAEYASYYDDSTAEQFVSLDLNNDGMVTPLEVIEVEGPEEGDRGRFSGGSGGFSGRPGGFGGPSSGFGGRPGGSTFGATSYRGGDRGGDDQRTREQASEIYKSMKASGRSDEEAKRITAGKMEYFAKQNAQQDAGRMIEGMKAKGMSEDQIRAYFERQKAEREGGGKGDYGRGDSGGRGGPMMGGGGGPRGRGR